MQKRSKGIVVSYLKVAVNMICGLVLSAALLRLLGDTENGIYQTISAFANYLVLLEFGMGTVMVRNISVCRGRCASDEEINKNISTIWTISWMQLLGILLVSVVFYFLIPVIYVKSMSVEQIWHARKIFVFITGYLVLSFLVQTLNGAILAYENYAFASLQGTIRTVARTILLLVVLRLYRNAVLIAVTDLLLSALCLGVSYGYCRRKLKIRPRLGVLDRTVLRTSLPLAFAVFLEAIVNQSNNNVDKFLIGILMSPESVSLYSVGLYVYSVFSSLTNVPLQMYAPSVTQKVGQGIRGEDLTEHLEPACRLTALTGGLVLFGFAAVGRQFVCMMYGETYQLAWPIAVLLMAPMYLNMVTGVLVNVLDALNKRMARSLVLIFTTVLNIVLTVFWLQRWGVIGATMASALCILIGQVLIMNLYYAKALRIPVLQLYRSAFQGIVVYLILGCGAALGVGSQIENVYVSFLMSGVVFVGVALGGYFLFGMNEEEKKRIRKFLRKKT